MTNLRVNARVAAAHVLSGALLIALPVSVARSANPEPIRTIDVAMSRYAFAPERIEVQVGERVRLEIRSMDRPHGFQVKELDLDARVPARGRAVIELTPKTPGSYRVVCSEYCGTGHSRMKAWLIVTPGR